IQVGSKYGFDVIPATSDVSCFGNTDGTISLTVKNGSGDYTYEWSGSGMGIVEGASSQAALGKGSYTVVVTDNQLGCKATKSNLVVNSPKSALTVDVLSVKNITCPGKVNAGNGGSIKLRISGGTTYTDAAQNGYYLVKVNGALVSCDKVSSGKLYSGNDASRANEYILDFFGQGASTASLASGDYHFDVTDLSGCSATADVSISQPEPINVTFSVTSSTSKTLRVDANGDPVKDPAGNLQYDPSADGTITINVSGGNPNIGTPKYHVNWSYSESIADHAQDASEAEFNAAVAKPEFDDQFRLTGLVPGTYFYRVTDYNVAQTGCEPVYGAIVVNDNGFFFSYNVTNNLCFNGAYGQIAITLHNGVAPYSITLSGRTSQTKSGLDGREIYYFDNLENYNYYVTVADGNGTSITKKIVVSNAGAELKVVTLSADIDCFDANTGVVDFSVEGGVIGKTGTTNYTVFIEGVNHTDQMNCDGNTQAVDLHFSDIPEGTYRLRVVDQNTGTLACEAVSAEFTLTQHHISYTTDVTNVSCKGGNDGEAAINVTELRNPTFQWFVKMSSVSEDAYKALTGKADYVNTSPVYVEIPSTVNASSNTSRLTGAYAGIYSVTVTPNGETCSKTVDNIEVVEPANALSSSLYKVDASGCADASNGRIHVVTINGTAPYSMTLYGAATPLTAKSETGDYWFENLAGASEEQGGIQYQVEVTDANGCQTSFNMTKDNDDDGKGVVYIYRPADLKVALADYGMAYNGTDASGFAHFNVSGGTKTNTGWYNYRVTLTGDDYVKSFAIQDVVTVTPATPTDPAKVDHLYTSNLSAADGSIDAATGEVQMINLP
ncbi:MAG: SprB repeat-containing protein, partial [Bacteroidales bacterium]|nr:SprB repeat-containing protein [Bacteroidales bacterium]